MHAILRAETSPILWAMLHTHTIVAQRRAEILSRFFIKIQKPFYTNIQHCTSDIIHKDLRQVNTLY